MKLRQSLWVLLSSVLLLFSGCDHPASWGGTAPQESQEPDYVSFFGADTVHDIYIELEEEDWQEILEDPEAKEYKIANVTIDGTTIEAVGVRTKGNSSIRMANRNDSDRFPLRIKFDEYVKQQTFLGLDELELNNSTDDASFLREYLGYAAFRQLGMDVPYVNFCNVYINGELLGLYIGVEAVDNSFLDRAFGNHQGNLYKAEVGATLEPDMDLDLLEQKKGQDVEKSDLTELIEILEETEPGQKGELESILDIDSVLQYMAVNAVIHNWDDYAGQFAQNYYLYLDEGLFHMIPWDLNEGFFQTQAYYEESDGARQDISTPITGDSTLEARPLVHKVLAVPEYYHQYLTYCDTLAQWLEDVLANELEPLKELIEEDVKADPTKFSTTVEFNWQFIDSNSYGLAGFIKERVEYLKEALPGLLEQNPA